MSTSIIQQKISEPEYATQSFTKTVSSANTPQSAFTIDVTKSGYTPVGIISAVSDGDYYSKSASLNGTTASFGLGFHIKKYSSSAAPYDYRIYQDSSTFTVTIKYIKN